MRLPRGALKRCSILLMACSSLLLCALLHTMQEDRTWPTGKSDLFIIPEYWILSDNSSLQMSDGMFVYNLNRDQHQSEFPYLQHYQCRLQQERLNFCRVPENKSLLLLATKSHPETFQRRVALRQTWARDEQLSDFVVKHVFLMAQSPNQTQMQKVAKENAAHMDILLWDFAESHHNLSLKERCFIEWLHYNCKEADFIFKGDDDEYVNTRALVEYLNETVNVSSAIHGFIHKGSDSERHRKYKITEDMYPSAKYPIFPSGGGYIIPGTFIPALYSASIWMPVFPLDDVYFGFLGLAAGVMYRHDYRFCVQGMLYDRCAFKKALVVHGIKPEMLIDIWQDVQNEYPCDPRPFWISVRLIFALLIMSLFLWAVVRLFYGALNKKAQKRWCSYMSP